MKKKKKIIQFLSWFLTLMHERASSSIQFINSGVVAYLQSERTVEKRNHSLTCKSCDTLFSLVLVRECLRNGTNYEHCMPEFC